jgi:hypothetical protein
MVVTRRAKHHRRGFLLLLVVVSLGLFVSRANVTVAVTVFGTVFGHAGFQELCVFSQVKTFSVSTSFSLRSSGYLDSIQFKLQAMCHSNPITKNNILSHPMLPT